MGDHAACDRALKPALSEAEGRWANPPCVPIPRNGSVFRFRRGGLGGLLEKTIQVLFDLQSFRMIRP